LREGQEPDRTVKSATDHPSRASAHRFFAQGLGSHARYRFADAYSSQSFEVTGALAMAEGIEVEQAPMSAKVLAYRKVPKP
jgi:hypothetical protein